MIILSERLRQLRKENRLTQQSVADRLGVKLRTYQYYESDTEQSHRPDLETLAALADLYEVSVDYLIGRTDAQMTGYSITGHRWPVKPFGRKSCQNFQRDCFC